MSIALIVTRGYGNGTLTGSIADVVTRGYSIGEAVEEGVTGGWLSPEQVRKLRNIARDADKAGEKKKERKERRKQRETRIAELETVFDAVHGSIPPVAAPVVREILEPFAESSDLPIPPPAAINFTALLADMEAVSKLAQTLILSSEDEEIVVLLMLSA